MKALDLDLINARNLSKRVVTITALPLGVTVQLSYFNEEWFIATKTMPRANECKYGG